jgi:hypothetical protein
VVEVVEEEVGEELLDGTEHAAGSMGWATKRRRLPPARCSRRKTTAGKSHGSASLAGAADRLLVQEERGAEQLGAQPNGGGEKVEWATTSSITSGVVVWGAKPRGAAWTGCHRRRELSAW